MGLYIPNAKMPESCCECYDAGLVAAQIVLGEGCPFCKQIGPPNAGLDQNREQDCPLLFVSAHGRLVDASKCEPYFYDHLDDLHMIAAQNAIDDMPTVIPAEEGEP